tara:strand:- start:337 stop:600 length:264 start_codon:yes stop_codon:yes gene_type:complete
MTSLLDLSLVELVTLFIISVIYLHNKHGPISKNDKKLLEEMNPCCDVSIYGDVTLNYLKVAQDPIWRESFKKVQAFSRQLEKQGNHE